MLGNLGISTVGTIAGAAMETLSESGDRGFRSVRAWWNLTGGGRLLMEEYRYRHGGYRVVDAVWGFFSIYVVVFSAMMITMMALGLDQVTAFSAVAATLNNLGPGLGEVSAGFMTLSDAAKWVAVAGMLLGRLEIFTLLVLITPTFWRR